MIHYSNLRNDNMSAFLVIFSGACNKNPIISILGKRNNTIYYLIRNGGNSFIASTSLHRQSYSRGQIVRRMRETGGKIIIGGSPCFVTAKTAGKYTITFGTVSLSS